VSLRGFLTQDQWLRLSELLSASRMLVDHPDFYKLSLLYLLTKPQLDSDPLAKLHNHYKLILHRRIRWKQDWIFLSHGDFKDPDELVGRVFESFELMRDVDRINQEMLAATPQ
jgi:hypothetical protein